MNTKVTRTPLCSLAQIYLLAVLCSHFCTCSNFCTNNCKSSYRKCSLYVSFIYLLSGQRPFKFSEEILAQLLRKLGEKSLRNAWPTYDLFQCFTTLAVKKYHTMPFFLKRGFLFIRSCSVLSKHFGYSTQERQVSSPSSIL